MLYRMMNKTFTDYSFDNYLYNVYLPKYGQVGFQDPATSIMAGIVDLHHTIFFYLIIIFFLVSWLLLVTIYLFGIKKIFIRSATFRHSFSLEVGWTVLPSLILLSIILPSLSLLYSIDDLPTPELTVKIIGRQWFWSYELTKNIGYEDFKFPEFVKQHRFVFDSNYSPKYVNIFESAPRLLNVDNCLYLPTFTNIRLLVTADDVIHSWAIPAFGIKIDGVPGRLNQVIFKIRKEGIFFGQCSELCGSGHGFMPIKVVSYNMAKGSRFNLDLIDHCESNFNK